MKVFAAFVNLYADYSDSSDIDEGFRRFHFMDDTTTMADVLREVSQNNGYLSESKEYISSFFIEDLPRFDIYKDSCSWSHGCSEEEEEVSYTVNIKEVTSRDMALGILYAEDSSLTDQEYEDRLPEIFKRKNE